MSRKRSSELTELQRRALECVRGAQQRGMALSAYCRHRRMSVRQVYDALVGLRRRGVAEAAVGRTRRRSKFVTVEISRAVPPLPARTAVCRVVLAGGVMVECGGWPPREWLESLSGGRSDAAA